MLLSLSSLPVGQGILRQHACKVCEEYVIVLHEKQGFCLEGELICG